MMWTMSCIGQPEAAALLPHGQDVPEEVLGLGLLRLRARLVHAVDRGAQQVHVLLQIVQIGHEMVADAARLLPAHGQAEGDELQVLVHGVVVRHERVVRKEREVGDGPEHAPLDGAGLLPGAALERGQHVLFKGVDLDADHGPRRLAAGAIGDPLLHQALVPRGMRQLLLLPGQLPKAGPILLRYVHA